METGDYLKDIDDNLEMRTTGSYVYDKYYYLKRYIDIFETSMKDKWPNRAYIDLFCGPGKCIDKDTRKIYIGSPLIALTTEYPFIQYYFVDYNKACISALRKRCSYSPINDRVNTYIGDANVEVNNIVNQIKKISGLNLALLDPEGFELHWETVRKLASINKMDLIIYYPQMGNNREMPKEVNNPRETKIDKFFGGKEWRTIYTAYKNKKEMFLHRKLIDLYKKKLRSIGYAEAKSIDEVETEPLIVNKLKAPLYRLIFASKHRLGQDFWKKITDKEPRGQTRLRF